MVAAGSVRVGAVVALGKALAAVIGFLQPVALDHGAHRAIDDQDAPGKRLLQGKDALGMQPGKGRHGGPQGLLAISEITSKCGGRFSRVTVSRLDTTSPAFSANLRSSLSEKPRLTWP
ncbi:hypothetical protein D3C86_597350 [compost metagenome]